MTCLAIVNFSRLIYLNIESEYKKHIFYFQASELRSLTQGKGEFAMEFLKYLPANDSTTSKLIQAYAASSTDKVAVKKKPTWKKN